MLRYAITADAAAAAAAAVAAVVVVVAAAAAVIVVVCLVEFAIGAFFSGRQKGADVKQRIVARVMGGISRVRLGCKSGRIGGRSSRNESDRIAAARVTK